jgi:hypothetical protein
MKHFPVIPLFTVIPSAARNPLLLREGFLVAALLGMTGEGT